MKRLLVLLFASLIVAACSQPAEPPAAAPTPAPAPAVAIKAPAGQYKIDPHHSSLSFRVSHLGLAPYVARFTRTDAVLDLDPANLAASKISVTIDPNSVRTDFSGDFKGSHQGTPYESFDEEIGKDAKFFNSVQFPQIGFQSTAVEVSGNNRLKVTGDLTFLGQTHPVTLDVTVDGSVAEHPWTKHGAVGFTATGSFKRSAFGMMHLLQPVLIGDEVSFEFNGEFHQLVEK